ncbi:DUF4145 domain-containing protein [Bradyrhizobium sp. S69]|uniref:DUF4145 domain-containing protein n=1 Tax=Bradyrhizobium sp. S69 TaxID=1641856 RepID=UPI00131D9FA4|nr:DUF4145 domain-containing protein [Bradyrhizobium sp. S69]
MAELVANCPRCGTADITFDVLATFVVRVQYKWLHTFETFGICRRCHRSTVFVISQKEIKWKERSEAQRPEEYKGALNDFFKVDGFVNLADRAKINPPEHTPSNIAAVFAEGASSIAVQNWNAAGAMFRLAINLATQPILPKEQVAGLTRRKRRDLGPRVEWLMQNNLITKDLYDLSECIREDGNDGAHDGTLKREDAADLVDFTVALFERMFTEPERLRLAKERRDKRREPEDKNGQ